MLKVTADNHPIMARMHNADLKLPHYQQDKRSVVVIEQGDVERWLQGSTAEGSELLAPPMLELIVADWA